MPVTRHLAFALLVVLSLTEPVLAQGPDDELFRDDFESDLAGWEISDPAAMEIVDSGDPERGSVLEMRPAPARLHALIRGSEEWPGYRIEGLVLFPTDEHNCLGLIYNYRETDGRVDLGSVAARTGRRESSTTGTGWSPTGGSWAR